MNKIQIFALALLGAFVLTIVGCGEPETKVDNSKKPPVDGLDRNAKGQK
jgi:PBP1b-binding outer membrane lipoprotein LpoB